MSLIILLAALLIGNLQVPASVAQVMLSCLRLRQLLGHHDYDPLPQGTSPNLVPSIAVFYVLALCQGTLYILACILGLFSFLPRRWLLRQSKFSGLQGAKAVDLYYQRAYATRMEIGMFARGNNINFASFTIESLSSSSHELQIAGVYVLDSILQRRDYNEELTMRVTNSNTAMSTLISMPGWTTVEESNVRLFASRVICGFANSLEIDNNPGMMTMVSSLLDAENVVANQILGQESSAQRVSGNGGNADGQSGCSWVCRRCWQRVKEKWSIPKEPPLTYQDSFPLLGMANEDGIWQDLLRNKYLTRVERKLGDS